MEAGFRRLLVAPRHSVVNVVSTPLHGLQDAPISTESQADAIRLRGEFVMADTQFSAFGVDLPDRRLSRIEVCTTGRERCAVTRLLKTIAAESALFREWSKGKHIAVTHDLYIAAVIISSTSAFSRPISAYFSGISSFRVSDRILVRRFERRSRQRRWGPWGSVRRNISIRC